MALPEEAAARIRESWQAYVAILLSRLRPSTERLSVIQDEGGDKWFRSTVAGPASVPEVTDASVAEGNPELAVLSAVVHGEDKDARKAATIAAVALAASAALEAERSRPYCDFIMASLSEAALQELEVMKLAKCEYQAGLAKRYIALGKEEGKAEGRAEGRAALVKRLLALRFGAPPAEAAAAHLAAASVEELDAIGERLLRAQTLDEALGKR